MMFASGWAEPSGVQPIRPPPPEPYRLRVGAGLAVHAGGDARGRGGRVPVVHQVLADRERVVAVGDVGLHGRAAARGRLGALGGRRRGRRRAGGRCRLGGRGLGGAVGRCGGRLRGGLRRPAGLRLGGGGGDGAAGRPGGPDHPGRGRVDAADADAAAEAGRERQVRGELGCLRVAAPGDQAVGGRPSHEDCGHPRGRDDPAGPLTGRLAPGVCCMPPGVLVGGSAGPVALARVPAVLAAASVEAGLAGAVTPAACGQGFPYAVPCPATQSQGGNLSPGLTSGNRSRTESQPANAQTVLFATHSPAGLRIGQSAQTPAQDTRAPPATPFQHGRGHPDNGGHAQRRTTRKD